MATLALCSGNTRECGAREWKMAGGEDEEKEDGGVEAMTAMATTGDKEGNTIALTMM
uniref:Uncharacterized protein n=1 Tax=Hyaloperonospora arabidopsidis (strain Emoy2) TaxID=559515 RepID=M4BIN6_HYAAE